MRWACCIAMACMAVMNVTTPALAAYTTINPPDLQSEDTRLEIFSKLFGGAFLPTVPGSRDYTNGHISAVRVEDVLGATIDGGLPSLTPGYGGDDQLWEASFQQVQARVVYGNTQESFGYFPGDSGGAFHELFRTTGAGYKGSGSADLTGLGSQPLRWAGGIAGHVFSSRQSDNPGSSDHLVTYRIKGLNDGMTSWLLMWDDSLPNIQPSSFDYNDLVVQINATQIPEPATLAPLLALALLARRARRGSRRLG